jgi:hypothetical protein
MRNLQFIFKTTTHGRIRGINIILCIFNIENANDSFVENSIQLQFKYI